MKSIHLQLLHFLSLLKYCWTWHIEEYDWKSHILMLFHWPRYSSWQKLPLCCAGRYCRRNPNRRQCNSMGTGGCEQGSCNRQGSHCVCAIRSSFLIGRRQGVFWFTGSGSKGNYETNCLAKTIERIIFKTIAHDLLCRQVNFRPKLI